MPHQPLAAELATRDTVRIAGYKRALAFYNGQQDLGTARARAQQQRITLNYTRTLIRKVTAFLMTGFEIGVDPPDEALEDAARAAEAALAEVSRNNDLPNLDYATEIDTAVLGDGAFKVTWDPDAGAVIVTSPDVQRLWAWGDPRDPNTTDRVAQQYTLTPPALAATWGILRAGHAPVTVTEDWTPAELRVHVDRNPLPEQALPNPYGWLPFVIFPNEPVPQERWGESDVLPLIDAARELNDAHTRLRNLLNLTGFPITVLEGVDSAEGLAAQAGAIWTLPTGARAYALDLLQHGAIGQHLAYLETIKSALFDLAETPRAAFGDNQRDLSGVALEVELLPLLHKVARKRAIRGTAYSNRASLILATLDRFTGTTHLNAGMPSVHWQTPTPRDRAREIRNESERIQNHLTSTRSALVRLGDVDPDTELAAIEDDARRFQPIDETGAPRP